MPKIFSTFVDHAGAQRAADQLANAGFAPADVYIDPATLRSPSSGPGHDDGHERQGVLESIGHAVASVAGMDTPDPEAQPYMEGRRRGGTMVVVDAIGEAETARAIQLLRAAGGMDVHEAGRRAQGWDRDRQAVSRDEDGLRNAEAERGRTVERALAADQASSERGWDPDAPPTGSDRTGRPPR